MQLRFSMNNVFFQNVSVSFYIHIRIFKLYFSFILIVSGAARQPQPYPGAVGYGDDYQNAGGTKQQLLNLIRSVRTVMRGKNKIY